MAKAKKPLPKTLGACADELYRLKNEEKPKLQKQLDALDARRKELEAHLVDQLDASDATGVRGQLVNASIVTERLHTAKDWPAIWKYIGRTKQWQLLQRRLNSKAINELEEAGKKVPGTEPFNKKKVSLTKVRTK